MQLLKLSMMYALIAASTILGIPKTVETNEVAKSESEETVSTLIRVCRVHALFPSSNPNNCAPNSIRIQVDENCKADFLAEIQAINLQDNPTIGTMYPLHTGMPPIFVEYGIKNGPLFKIGPITELEFKGNYAHDVFNVDHPVFEVSQILTIDVTDYCGPGNQNANVPTVIKVLDDTGAVYPVDDYAGPYEAFYCAAFEETCDQCTACSSGFDPVYNINLCGACGACESGENNSAYQNNDNSGFNVEVIQNPFIDEISFDLPISKEKIFISVIDMTGKKLIQQEVYNDKYITNMTLDAQQLSNGMYILQLQSGKSTTSQRIMKTK